MLAEGRSAAVEALGSDTAVRTDATAAAISAVVALTEVRAFWSIDRHARSK